MADVTLDDGTVASYLYDVTGHQTNIVNGAGTVRMVYGPLGALLEESDANGKGAWAYDVPPTRKVKRNAKISFKLFIKYF